MNLNTQHKCLICYNKNSRHLEQYCAQCRIFTVMLSAIIQNAIMLSVVALPKTLAALQVFLSRVGSCPYPTNIRLGWKGLTLDYLSRP
jgi:hypothetical protein